MTEMENAPGTVIIGTQQTNRLTRLLGRAPNGTGNYTGRSPALPPGSKLIIVARKYPTGIGISARLAHELGHAYQALIEGLGDNEVRSLQVEGLLRTMRKSPARSTYETQVPRS